jgi:uroporphyrinogen III methyltransferase/synthase
MTTRTLVGMVIVVTRPREQSGELAMMLDARGGHALLAPAIELSPAPPGELEAAVRDLAAGGFDWVLLTSRAGVDALLAQAGAIGATPQEALQARVAAIGKGTAEALRARGVEPDLVPETFTTFALGRALPRGTGRVLLARADIAPGELEGAVASKGWTPVRVDAYHTRLAHRLPAEVARALQAGEVDAVTFTSVSTVHGFLRGLEGSGVELASWPTIACIGPVTARAVTDAGLEVAGVASPHTIEGLVEALEHAVAAHGERSRLSKKEHR